MVFERLGRKGIGVDGLEERNWAGLVSELEAVRFSTQDDSPMMQR